MMARSAARSLGFSHGSLTLTGEEPSSSSPLQEQPQSLVLRLKPPKKIVTWKEGTVDNEFLGRKSSKKCCIFHKEKPFDEDDSDGEHGNGSNFCNGPSKGSGECPVLTVMGVMLIEQIFYVYL